jgi:S1-C subfamily serine protease
LEIQRLASPFLPTDSTSFYNAGVPSLAFFTGIHEEYHTPADTPEKIDYEGILKVAQYVQHLTDAVANLESAPKYSKVDRSRPKVQIGIQMEDAGKDRGVNVVEVMAGSPAEKAGILAGDVVKSLDGKPVKNMESILAILTDLKAGTNYSLSVLRGETMKDLSIQPVKN